MALLPSPEQSPTAIASPLRSQGRSSNSITTESVGNVVDLLKLADATRDTLSGQWSLKDGSLISGPLPPWPRFQFMYVPPTEYDYRVVFTRMEGDNIILFICYAGGHQFAFDIAGDHNKTCTFERIDGEYTNLTTRHSDGWLVNGHQYTCVIKVRKDGVKVFLDGALLDEWKTDYHDMTLAPGWALRRGDIIGLGNADDNRTVFNSVEVVEINGTGNRLSQVSDTKPEVAARVVAPDPLPTTQNPQAQPPTPPKPKMITLESLLAQLPKEAQPPWDDFSIPHAHKWLMQALADKELQMAVGIKDVQILRFAEPGDPDKTREWDIWVTTNAVRTHTFNMEQVLLPATWIPTAYLDPQTLAWTPLDPPGFSWYADSQLQFNATGGKVIIRADEDVAKRARSWQVGDTIILAGAVDNVDFIREPPTGRFNLIFQKHVRAVDVIPAGTKNDQKHLSEGQTIIVNSTTH
jgi:hypothetical protein